jgi:ABC-2 type transport system permease protein
MVNRAAWVGCRTIWLRDLVVFRREWARPAAMIGQPVLYLLILGTGINASMKLDNAPPGLDYLRFMYPGVIGMSVLFTSIFSAISIIWDREFGFLKEVLVSPVPRWGVALGKILGGATVATIQCIVLLALAPFVHVSLTPAVIGGVLGYAFLTSVALTGLGVAIAARMESMQSFQMILNFLVMPLYFLSGAMFPITMAPHWMKVLMHVNPLSYGVDAYRAVLMAGTDVTVAGHTLPMLDVARQAGIIRWSLPVDAAVLCGFVLVLCGTAAVRFNQSE